MTDTGGRTINIRRRSAHVRSASWCAFVAAAGQTPRRSRFVARTLVLTLVLTVAGCATSTAPSKGPQIAAELRPSQRSADPVSKEQQAKQYFIRGMTQAQIGNHEDALEYYSRAIRLAPTAASVFAAAAESHEALGNETDALYHARKARELGRDNPHHHSQLAQLYLSLGRTEQAADAYLEMREIFPGNLDALYELARVYTIDGEYARAIETYEDLLSEVGSDRDVQQEILHLYRRLGDQEGMERVLKSMIDEQPNDPELRRTLGDIYTRQQRATEAATQLQKALELNPGDVETLLALTDLYRSLGRADSADALLERAVNVEGATPTELVAQAASMYSRTDDDPEALSAAEQLLERALEMDPTNADALVMLGDIRLGQGDAEGAGELLYRALEENPRDPQLWMQASGAYLQAGMVDRSIEVADEGLLLFPGHIPLLRISGYAMMESFRNQAAIQRFEQTARIIREDRAEAETELADVLGALGLLYSRVKDYTASDNAYEAAVETDPNNATVLNNYAYSLAVRGIKFDRALRLAMQAVELEPGVPSFLDTLGWVYFQRGEYEWALRWLEKASVHADATAAVFEHLGDTYSKLDRAAEAREAWLRAIEMNPDSSSLSRKLGQSQ